MELNDLVRALLAGDLLSARQWVADARRAHLQWERVRRPAGPNEREMVVAAGLAELLAARSGSAPPPWTVAIGGAAEALFLDPGIEQMPRTLAWAKSHAPEALRKRNLFASPDFLDGR